MWKIILKIAVAVGQSEWAKRKAAAVVDKLISKANQKAADITIAVDGVAK